MIDGCGREIDHLRLSLTDHCNLACRYCTPGDAKPSGQMIDPDFAFETVRWLVEEHGIRHVRLTGGEPLLYPHLLPLARRIRSLAGLHQMTLTTNGQALEKYAVPLRDAGLDRINVSLDTLKPDAFKHLTRGGRIDHTLRGVHAAVEAGLTPVKVNLVVQRGVNHDELCEITEWGLKLGCVVRFLEVMPIGPLAHLLDQHLVPAAEILERLGERFHLTEIPRKNGSPAVDYVVRRRQSEPRPSGRGCGDEPRPSEPRPSGSGPGAASRPSDRRPSEPRPSGRGCADERHPPEPRPSGSDPSIEPRPSARGHAGHAQDPDILGVIGLIASTTRPFCDVCRRLRLTAHGDLVPCVHDPRHYSIRPCWESRRLDAAAAGRILATAIGAKLPEGPKSQSLIMLTLGG
ncbi:MAG: radical SAM protein [Phycisphaerales bacterium]|nr:MAG: radical SAM protein [Phycisphaerales bacterium]